MHLVSEHEKGMSVKWSICPFQSKSMIQKDAAGILGHRTPCLIT